MCPPSPSSSILSLFLRVNFIQSSFAVLRRPRATLYMQASAQQKVSGVWREKDWSLLFARAFVCPSFLSEREKKSPCDDVKMNQIRFNDTLQAGRFRLPRFNQELLWLHF